jgi:uncharacterized protein YceH (UPF0502 family)
MYQFTNPAQVEETLQSLASGEEPLVVQLSRQPGQNERRWTHLLQGEPDQEVMATPITAEPDHGLARRVSTLETQVAQLSDEIARLRELIE